MNPQLTAHDNQTIAVLTMANGDRRLQIQVNTQDTVFMESACQGSPFYLMEAKRWQGGDRRLDIEMTVDTWTQQGWNLIGAYEESTGRCLLVA